jgi:hypothetical protein
VFYLNVARAGVLASLFDDFQLLFDLTILIVQQFVFNSPNKHLSPLDLTMLFAAPVVVAMAYGPLVAFVVTKKRGIRKTGVKASTEETGTTEPAEGFDANGLITTWKLASPEDTRLLKELVTSGALIKDQAHGINMKPDEVKAQFPRFKRFSNSCLSSKISNLRRDFRDAIEKRARSMSLLARLSLLVMILCLLIYPLSHDSFFFFLQWRINVVEAKALKPVTTTASVLVLDLDMAMMPLIFLMNMMMIAGLKWMEMTMRRMTVSLVLALTKTPLLLLLPPIFMSVGAAGVLLVDLFGARGLPFILPPSKALVPSVNVEEGSIVLTRDLLLLRVVLVLPTVRFTGLEPTVTATQ